LPFFGEIAIFHYIPLKFTYIKIINSKFLGYLIFQNFTLNVIKYFLLKITIRLFLKYQIIQS
jgi:hypothetical protein